VPYCRCHYHHNPDDDLRRLQRLALQTGDPSDQARYITARLRAGEISQSNIEIASELGHPAAQILIPCPVNWRNWDIKETVLKLINAQQCSLVVRIMAEYAQRALIVFETGYPEDVRPKLAVEAAIRWYQEPNGANAAAAAEASGAAEDAGNRTALRAVSYAASCAARAAAGAAKIAYLCMDRTDGRFSLAENRLIGGITASAADNAANAIAYSGTGVKRSPTTFDDECQWQSNFLAEVLLGLRSI